jgi:hypothetical protein
MLPYNDIKTLVNFLPIAMAIFYFFVFTCILMPKKKPWHWSLLAGACFSGSLGAFVNSFLYSIIADNFFEWVLTANWMLIGLIWANSLRKVFGFHKKLLEIDEFVKNDLKITIMLNEGKYERFQPF